MVHHTAEKGNNNALHTHHDYRKEQRVKKKRSVHKLIIVTWESNESPNRTAITLHSCVNHRLYGSNTNQ